MASRMGMALAIAALGSIEASILSVPLGFALGMPHAPKSEFAGLAVFGTVLITGAATAALVFSGLLYWVAMRYTNYHADRWWRIVGTLLASIAMAIVVVMVAGRLGNGLWWAIGVSAAVMVGGLAWPQRTPAEDPLD